MLYNLTYTTIVDVQEKGSLCNPTVVDEKLYLGDRIGDTISDITNENWFKKKNRFFWYSLNLQRIFALLLVFMYSKGKNI